MVTQNGPEPPRVVGRYMLFDEIAAGGMATVRYGRLIGEVGFSRTVAVKCLHAHFAKDEEFAKMFLDEARLAARVRHPNVVPILDVVARDGELFLIMDYVQGESLSKLIRATRARKSRIPLRIIASIMAGVLDGLHAAHEAKSEHGEPLGIVHRDVSPQNVIVGMDGVSRVLDFGVAKAAGRMQSTRDGQLKGKLAYMAPEQLKSEWVDRRTDVYAASVVLWEALTGTRLFKADDEIGVFGMVLQGKIAPPSSVIPSIPKGYDDVTMRGLHLDPGQRFATARDMATALEKVAGVASPREVGGWVEELARDTLRKRADKIAELESVSTLSVQAMIARGATGEPPPVSIGPVPSGPVSAQAPPPPRPGLPPPRVPPPPRRPAPSVGTISGVHAPVSITQVTSDADDEAMTIISDTTASSVALSTAAGTAPAVQLQEPVSSPSQMTSLSMAQEPPRAGPKPRVLMAVIAVALVLSSLAVAGVVVVSGMLQPKGDGVPDAGPASGLGATDKADADPQDVVFVEADASSEGAANVTDAAADARAEASGVATAKKPPPSGTVRVPPPPTTAEVKPPPTQTAVRPPPTEATSKPPKGDCNPPYTIDARGVRVPKVHCL
jgi:serine/threonine-protein kinase